MFIVEHLLVKSAIDIVAAFLFTFGVYKRRYNNNQLAVSMLMLNVFVFCIMGVITGDNFGLQAGLGLFAILSIFRFRSENFEQVDIAYFFGAVALATVNGVAALGPVLYLVNIFIVGGAYIIDIDAARGRMQSTEVILENIPSYLFNETEARSKLGLKFGITIYNLSIEAIDYVKETAKVRVQFIADRKEESSVDIT